MARLTEFHPLAAFALSQFNREHLHRDANITRIQLPGFRQDFGGNRQIFFKQCGAFLRNRVGITAAPELPGLQY